MQWLRTRVAAPPRGSVPTCPRGSAMAGEGHAVELPFTSQMMHGSGQHAHPCAAQQLQSAPASRSLAVAAAREAQFLCGQTKRCCEAHGWPCPNQWASQRAPRGVPIGHAVMTVVQAQLAVGQWWAHYTPACCVLWAGCGSQAAPSGSLWASTGTTAGCLMHAKVGSCDAV